MDSQARSWDFGDAPASYGTLLADDGARHVISGGLFLGSLIDLEFQGLPDAGALGDDALGLADEDGVTLPARFVPGQLTEFPVVASRSGNLSAWLDVNNDGQWTAGEQIFADRPLVAGANMVSFTVPSNAATSPRTFARFRFSSDSGLSPVGPASDGEVEDYAVAIIPENAVCFAAGPDMHGEVNGGSATAGGVDVWLDDVAVGGCLTVDDLVAPPNDPPPEFDFLIRPGNPRQFWNFEPDSELDFGSATLTFGYDEGLLSGPEGNLKVFHLTDMGLERLDNLIIDEVANTVTFDVTEFSYFAVSTIPEPSSLMLAALGLIGACCYVRRRRRTTRT